MKQEEPGHLNTAHASPTQADPPLLSKLTLRSWLPTLALLAAVLIARLVYAAWLGVYTLAEDEAHYWEWSRRLDWSYYSKGPGIAWLIRVASELWGATEAGIRAPAAIAHAIGGFAVAGLARSIWGDPRAGFVGAALFMLLPLFQAVAVFMTIDGPYVACWAVAAWAGYLAMERGGRWSWVVLGAAIAVGFLFKYTIVLLLPGLVMHALVRRRRLVVCSTWGRWVLACSVLALLGLVPVLIWNAQHDWSTVRHLMGHARMAGGDQMPNPHDPPPKWNLLWTLEYVGVQLAVIGPAVVLLIGAALSGRHEAKIRGGWVYALSLALPMLGFYGVLSVFAPVEGNWPMAAYVSLLALAGGHVAREMEALRDRTARWLALPPDQRPRAGILRRRPESVAQIAWHWSIGFGLVSGLLMLRLDLLAHVPWPAQTHPMERAASRVMFADVRAAHVQRLIEQIRAETGQDPVVIVQQYGSASQLAYYLQGQPVVYSSSSLMWGRRTQYDIWEQTNLRSSDVVASLQGRPGVMLGGYPVQWEPVFERTVLIGDLEGESKAGREAYLGYGFLGFPGYQLADFSPVPSSTPESPTGSQ